MASLATNTGEVISLAPTVFINCPYDREFEELRDSILLSVVFCGYTPASPMMSTKTGATRVDRILAQLSQSVYSIHDLSRCQEWGAGNVARFDMPLELGMAMMLVHTGCAHDWMALVPEGTNRFAFASDLDGFDPVVYDGSIESVVRKVVAALTVRPEASRGVRPSHVITVWPEFVRRKRDLQEDWGDAGVDWHRLTSLAKQLRAEYPPQ